MAQLIEATSTEGSYDTWIFNGSSSDNSNSTTSYTYGGANPYRIILVFDIARILPLISNDVSNINSATLTLTTGILPIGANYNAVAYVLNSVPEKTVTWADISGGSFDNKIKASFLYSSSVGGSVDINVLPLIGRWINLSLAKLPLIITNGPVESTNTNINTIYSQNDSTTTPSTSVPKLTIDYISNDDFFITKIKTNISAGLKSKASIPSIS